MTSILLVMCRNWAREGWRWMLAYSLRMCLLMLWSTVLLLSSTSHHIIYVLLLSTTAQIILDEIQRPTKVCMLIGICVKTGNKPQSLDVSAYYSSHCQWVNVSHLWWWKWCWGEDICNFPSVRSAVLPLLAAISTCLPLEYDVNWHDVSF